MSCGCIFGSCIRTLCCCGSKSCRDENCGEWIMNLMDISVTHAAILDLHSPLDHAELALAWEKTLKKNPFLHAKWIAGFIKNIPVEKSKPKFIKCAESSFSEEFNKTANYKVQSSQLIVCDAGLTAQIIVATPHSIADGTSMMLILHDLLTFYESPHLEQNLVTEYPTSAHHLFPPLDKKQMRTVQNKMKAQAKTYKNVVPHVQFKKSRPKPSKIPTKITLGVGTPEGSDKILKFCRKNGITIGTYLTAAFAFINSKITNEHSKDLRFGLDYNLRDRFPKKMGNTTVGLYICENAHQPNAELDETLVQVSKRMKEDIQEFLQTQEMFMQKALIELFIKNHKELTPAAQNHTLTSVNFSNVGKYKADVKYSFGTVREMYCSGYGWDHYEYTFLFQTTDRLCITITNMDMELYNSSAQAYIDGFLELTEDPEKYEFETLRSYANL